MIVDNVLKIWYEICVNKKYAFQTKSHSLPGAGEDDSFVVSRPLQLALQDVAVDKVERDHGHLQQRVAARLMVGCVNFPSAFRLSQKRRDSRNLAFAQAIPAVLTY